MFATAAQSPFPQKPSSQTIDRRNTRPSRNSIHADSVAKCSPPEASSGYVSIRISGCLNYVWNAWVLFQVHERGHTGEKPFPCDLCDFRATSVKRVTAHKKRQHENRPKNEVRDNFRMVWNCITNWWVLYSCRFVKFAARVSCFDTNWRSTWILTPMSRPIPVNCVERCWKTSTRTGGTWSDHMG